MEINTLELTKQCQVNIKMEEYTHQARVAIAIGIKNPSPVITNRTIKKLEDINCRMFVKRKEVYEKFKYHAGIKGSETKLRVTPMIAFPLLFTTILIWLGFNFIGLWVIIPISGMMYWLSQYIREVATDYVGDIPEFVLDNMSEVKRILGQLNVKFTIHSAKPLPTKEYFIKTDPVMIAWLDSEIGVVVGIWDEEKEIEII